MHCHRIAARSSQLRASAGHIELTDLTFSKASPDQFQCVFPEAHGAIEDIQLRIELAQIEIVLRHVSLQGKLHGTEQGRARLGVCIRRGDTIVTSGGIIAKVVKVEDNELQVEIADGVKIKMVRGTVSEVRNKADKTETPAAPKAKAAS